MKILGDELEAKFLAVPGPHIPDPYDADAPLANNPPEALLGPGAGTRPTAVLQQTNLQEVTEAIRQTFSREDFEAAWLQVETVVGYYKRSGAPCTRLRYILATYDLDMRGASRRKMLMILLALCAGRKARGGI